MKKNNPQQAALAMPGQNGQPVLHPHRPLSRGAKCSRCRAQAEIHLPSHHANFCPDCFLHFVRTAVIRGLKEIKFQPRPLMVAVSGGKDSLAVWDLLHYLGYETKGLHINLGIDDFSEASSRAVAGFASARGLDWTEYSLQEIFGYSIPQVQRLLRGKTCALCGKLKRAFFNRLTIKEGFDTLVTGHNLDDESSRLLGNLVGKRLEHVHKQSPYLPSPHPRIPAKLKPLYRLEIKELLAYCQLCAIIPVQETCSFARGATSRAFLQALDFLEGAMPGTKRSFLFAYLRDTRLKEQLGSGRKTQDQEEPTAESESKGGYGICQKCQEPAYGHRCGICTLRDRLQKKEERESREQRAEISRKGETDAN